jgi:glycosyltransferase involved in cell wall biosynthesis
MRLLYLTDRYWPAIGGIESLVRTLAHEMVRQGHQVNVIAISDQQRPVSFAQYGFAAPTPHSYPDSGVAVRILGARTWQRIAMLPIGVRYLPYFRSRAFGELAELSLPAFVWAHSKTLDQAVGESDAVHCFGAQYLGAAGLRAAHRAGKPFVITPFCHPGHWGDDPMNVATYRHADAVLALHDADAETYLRLGVDADRIGIMPVPLAPISTVESKPEASRFVLFLGRVNNYKGIDRLFAAWPEVYEQTGCELVVAGPAEGPIVPPTGARYVGVVSEAEKARLLSSAAVLTLPSSGELLPNVVLEAWAAGVPVVVSDVPTLAAFVHHGVDGLVTSVQPKPLAAALIRCLEDRELRDRLGESGRMRVATTHSPGMVAAGLLDRYRELSRARFAMTS